MHVLASLLLARGFFPRRPWSFFLAFVLAGTLADLDLVTLLFGPSAYFAGRQTWTHSIFGTIAIVWICALVGRSLGRKSGPPQKAGPTTAGVGAILLAASIAAAVHLLMDLSTASGVAVLWPFRPTRFAWDILPSTDPWILSLLVAGILLPELFRLIGSEIGAKDKAPRGQNGALLALVLICLYIGARLILHGDARAQLDAHSYRGESPRRVAAIPDSLSLLTWYGIVETTAQICTVVTPASSATPFDPEASVCLHKPEPSPALNAALQTESLQRFVAVARFPKASVGAREDGTEIVVREIRGAAESQGRFALAAQVQLDPSLRVTSQRIIWARQARLR